MNRSDHWRAAYLYEINLRRFWAVYPVLRQYRSALLVRLWKDDDNTYHLKRDVGR